MTASQELSKYVKGLNFPAGRGQVLQWVRAHNAPIEAVRALEALPNLSYSSLREMQSQLAEAQLPEEFLDPDKRRFHLPGRE